MKKIYSLLIVILFATISQSQTIGTPEIADNETAANAQLITSPAKIRGSVFPNGDLDWFRFTATAGDRVYAAVMTSFSASASTDAQLRLYASDGTTVIEFDEDDGALGGLSSTIAGATIPSNGTYYLQVKHFSATNTLRPYDLYFNLKSGVPVAEVEPNDGQGTAMAMPASGWVSGSRDPALATEQDWFSVTLLAGETVFISMDLDPERDNVQYNGRLGFALFGDANNQVLVVDDASAGSVANPLSEFFVFTAKDAGTYYVFADAASAATGGPTATYNISYTKFAATSATTPYDSYVSADVPKIIGPSAGFVTSTISVPANTKRVKDVIIRLNLDHALMADIDAELTTPEGNTIALFNDIGATATGGQTQMDLSLSDNNAIPFVFTVVKGVGLQPELNYPLSHLRGMQTSGVWTLTLRDDLTNTSGGNLLGWSIEFLEDVPPNLTGATTIVNEDFEAGDGGFTHSGAADEWERGTPATVATTTTNPVAAFNTANSGVNCWKTDLDNTYNVSSAQTLLSPAYVIPAGAGTIWLSWAMKLQMESATFDKVTIRVYEDGNPSNSQILYQWLGATMSATVGSPTVNVPISTPWGVYWMDISAFKGMSVRFEIVVETDSSINYGGVAFDDIQIYSVPPPCTPSSITLGVSPIVCSGSTSTNLPYTATTGSPNIYSIDYDAAAEAQGFVDVVNAALPASPIALVVPGAAIAATYNATITVQNNMGGCLSPAVPFTVNVTNCTFPCFENFDAVVVPALPLGWVATTGGGSCLGSASWETTAAASASAPNAAFTNAPNCVSDERLDTRPFAIPASGTSRLSFFINYNLETIFDGMVLEMSLNAGPFVDIITAGGVFAAGGYTHTISSSFLNPLAGRMAWSGNSAGFIPSAIDLPVSANGQSAVFRFRRGTDNSVANVGVYLDEVTVGQTADISYAGTPYCSNGGTASVTLTGTSGGIFSSTAGLSINSGTGAVDLAASTPGSYTVTYSLSAGPGCLFTTTAPITITALPVATISYASNPYCQNAGTATVTQTGAAGGVYSSTAGLMINPATGAVTLGTSTPGTYTVSYTIPAAAGCPSVIVTTPITITALPVATISYAGSPYCQSGGTVSVTQTGATGGVYSATPAGLSINASTGLITLGTSLPGAYTISYTIAAAGGCPAVVANASIVVKATPVAIATPASQTVCNATPITTIVLSSSTPSTTYAWIRNNTATVTGIAANGTGNISGTLTNTTNAPVTVTFTITPTADGCVGPTTTATVTVQPTPTVNPIANQTVCNGTMTAPVSFSGTVAGTTYNWVNTTTSIGLAASGTGNIAAFTGTNATLVPVTATVTVTPVLTITGAPVPVTFSNASNIAIPAAPTTTGISSPYPSPITVSGLPTTGVTVQSITFNGLQHTFASDIEVLLVGPGGQKFVPMSDVGSAAGFDATATITLQDGAPALPITSTAIPTGTYGPTSNGALSGFPAPAPAAPYNQAAPTGTSTFANIFNNTSNYNGTWSLYVKDDLGGDIGNMSGGWSITFLAPNVTTCTGPTQNFTITVNPTPTITCPGNITIASTVGACNVPVPYTVSATGTPTPTFSYVLTGATTGSGAGTGTGLLFNVGVTTVTVTATNICAAPTCTFTVTVTDSQLPVINTQPANRTVCVGSSATFSVAVVTAPSAGGPLSYQWQQWNPTTATWSNVTGATGATTNTLTLSNVTQSMNTNSYRVVVTGLCTVVTSGFATLYVNPLPVVNLTTSIPPILLPTQVLTITATVSPTGGTFVWRKDGNAIAGATGSTLSGLTVSDAGTYSVVYTNLNGCTSTSSNIVVTSQPSENLYVYPVPNRGVFNVRFYNQTGEAVTVRVFDAKGSEVYQRKSATTIPYTTINVDMTTRGILAAGVYIVEVRGADNRLIGTKKIIVHNN